MYDFIVKSGNNFYPIIVINENITKPLKNNVFNVYFGRDNTRENPDFVDYLLSQKEKLFFLKNISKNNEKNSDEVITKFKQLQIIEKLLKNIKENKNV